jgi:AraC-like DNA-binding protein
MQPLHLSHDPHVPPRSVAQLEAAALAQIPLAPLVVTTHGLSPAEQFTFWRDNESAMLEHLPVDQPDTAGFKAQARTWRFGDFAAMRIEIGSGRYRRTAGHAKRDGLDHWTLTLAMRGRRVFRSGDTVQVMRPGAAHLGALDSSFETQRTDSDWVHLYLPRDAFPEIAAAIDAARQRPVPGAMGQLLHDYLAILARELPGISAAEAPRVAEATRAILAATLAPSPDRTAAAAAPLRQTQFARVRRIVRDNLGSATLGPERLCRLAGMSRSQLYRLFEPLGGVAAHIQAERLRAAQRALVDPADRRSIASIAEAVGLFDCSSFSRMFRRAYGCSPREMRIMALADPASIPAKAHAKVRAPLTISDLLRAL